MLCQRNPDRILLNAAAPTIMNCLRAGEKYCDVQRYFMSRLLRDVDIYQELHALIVAVSKKHCKKEPACDGCPLARMCARARRERGHSAKVNI